MVEKTQQLYLVESVHSENHPRARQFSLVKGAADTVGTLSIDELRKKD
ncbi:hypothetical protein NBRC111894_4156 [Sporolactobacillus inulinus]|uniref:Uncharacterized protein n=1 Tax=Sporolactobacillus inulinus TaxID=2078 RepID=A0A4Y1ZHC2_9BACL|nr:hypothetical protein NBRC111894_4156 [Sporolactobacillus inulinus]